MAARSVATVEAPATAVVVVTLLAAVMLEAATGGCPLDRAETVVLRLPPEAREHAAAEQREGSPAPSRASGD
jgi:hypothetical protein